MANPYGRQQVLDIIERKANERGISRDDFLRFAHIETGGVFNPALGRGAEGAKGLFQFMPDTARQYGIAGRELDPVANTDAAARLYLDNRTALVSDHQRNDRPYLSGEAQPNGLDLYLAHQQGAAGYASIQNAIATGRFTLDSTRGHLLNNVHRSELGQITGVSYDRFKEMAPGDMAKTFVSYWDTQYERIRIPEKGIEPLDASGRQQTPTRTQSPPQPQAQMPAKETPGGIVLETAYQQTLQYDHTRYQWGGKDVDSGGIDCAGWVVRLQNASMDEINRKAGTSVFSPQDKFSPGWHNAARIVELSAARSGVMIRDRDITPGVLKEGMILGEDQPPNARGIDHIVMVVRNPNNGQLMISQSRSGEGVGLISVEKYLANRQEQGVRLYATDPLAQARNLLQDRRHTRSQGWSRTPSTTISSQSADDLLQQGSSGADVKRLQETMNRLGYRDNEGKALGTDGVFGSRTEQAVRAFQKARGIGVDGVVGPDTRTAIGQAQQSAERTTGSGLLKPGMRGPEIKQLQEALNRYGFRDAEGKTLGIDGIFGDKTRQAVGALQKTYGIGSDGKVGPDTWNALAQAQQRPLLTDTRNPDHAMQQQAYDCLKRLDPAKLQFTSELQYRNAASTTALEAKVGGMTRIDSIMLNRDGTSLAAMQGEAGHPGNPRVYVDKAQAASQSMERSTSLMDQETRKQAEAKNQQQQASDQQTPKTVFF
ncbi:MAG: peptidoglycan-binding protein [Xanthomonadaceae bacterium]|jgi:peptidoglycan hydrolase-like protein with peptidoglycan-binding domain|nr:peptidoglycan-binding protein [Xanthomonadaceae bacterium]